MRCCGRHGRSHEPWHRGVRIDWCCFYLSIRNSLVACESWMPSRIIHARGAHADQGPHVQQDRISTPAMDNTIALEDTSASVGVIGWGGMREGTREIRGAVKLDGQQSATTVQQGPNQWRAMSALMPASTSAPLRQTYTRGNGDRQWLLITNIRPCLRWLCK